MHFTIRWKNFTKRLLIMIALVNIMVNNKQNLQMEIFIQIF